MTIAVGSLVFCGSRVAEGCYETQRVRETAAEALAAFARWHETHANHHRSIADSHVRQALWARGSLREAPNFEPDTLCQRCMEPAARDGRCKDHTPAE